MGDPKPAAAAAVPPPAPVPATSTAVPDVDRLTARLQELDQTLYDQTMWVEDMLAQPFAQMSEMRATLRSLSSRLDDLEGYFGLQDGAQPIVLYNGSSYQQVHYMGIAEGVESDGEWSNADEEIALPVASVLAPPAFG